MLGRQSLSSFFDNLCFNLYNKIKAAMKAAYAMCMSVTVRPTVRTFSGPGYSCKQDG